MADRRYGHRMKTDVETPLLKRINVNALLPRPCYSKLFYEILHGLEFASLPFEKQMRAVNLATAYVHRIECWRDKDFQAGALIQRQLTTIENSMIDNSSKKTEKDSELDSFLADLQCNDIDDD